MATATNIYGFNIGGNNNSFDQRGHFYRAFLDGNVSGMLVKQNTTPNMTVLVEHGSALLNKNTTSASIAEIKSDTSVTIDTANTSNPRIDTVVIYEDTSIAIPTVEANYWQDGAGGRFKVVSLPGTAGAAPVALSDTNIQTAIGAGKPWARLANITVPANSSTIINSNINNSVRSKLGVPLNSVNGGTTAGVLTTDASGNVTSQGAWSTWTPTLANHSGTVNVARYTLVGKTCQFYLKVTLTSAASAAINFTLPVTASSSLQTGSFASALPTIIGYGGMIKNGIGYFQVFPYLYSTTQANLGVLVSSGGAGTYLGYQDSGPSRPATWVMNDQYIISGAYEAA